MSNKKKFDRDSWKASRDALEQLRLAIHQLGHCPPEQELKCFGLTLEALAGVADSLGLEFHTQKLHLLYEKVADLRETQHDLRFGIKPVLDLLEQMETSSKFNRPTAAPKRAVQSG